MSLGAAAIRALEDEGWRVDWESDTLADALEDAAPEPPQGAAAKGSAAARGLGIEDVRGVLLDLDLRKVRRGCERQLL